MGLAPPQVVDIGICKLWWVSLISIASIKPACDNFQWVFQLYLLLSNTLLLLLLQAVAKPELCVKVEKDAYILFYKTY